jgi:hypothetical protein
MLSDLSLASVFLIPKEGTGYHSKFQPFPLSFQSPSRKGSRGQTSEKNKKQRKRKDCFANDVMVWNACTFKKATENDQRNGKNPSFIPIQLPRPSLSLVARRLRVSAAVGGRLWFMAAIVLGWRGRGRFGVYHES